MNLRQVLPSGFGIVFLVVIINTIVSDITTNTLEDAAQWVAHTHQVKGFLAKLEKTLVDAETGQRGFIYSGEEVFLEPYDRALSSIDDQIENLAKTISDNAVQTNNLKEVRELARKKFEELETTIAYKKAGREAELRELVLSGLGRQIMDEIGVKIDNMEKIEDRFLEERSETAKAASIFVRIVNYGSLAIVLIVCVVTVLIINKIAIEPIKKIANTIASSTAQIATTIREQERVASEQANSVSTTTTTMNELSASSRQCSEQAQLTVNSAQEALQVAEHGGVYVAETLEGMTQLKQKVGEIASQIFKLNEQNNEIGTITKMVSDLANQTNMLALNAAVEAVRAGENGKGFAVVAGEIRKLAEESRGSAKKINDLVREIQDLINSTRTVTDAGTQTVNWGLKVTEETTGSFHKIADSVNNVVINNQAIHLNTQQQAAAVSQVLEAMNALENASRETAAGITQTRQGTEQLNQAALDLKAII